MKRVKQAEQAPHLRVNNFEEVTYCYTDAEAIEEASRCLNCKNAPCVKGCPVGVNIPAFIQKVISKNTKEALKIISSTNNLPAICGRVCPQEEQCEKLCVRKRQGEPIAIGALERYVADSMLKRDSNEDEEIIIEEIDKHIAVIGSGPSSLTCAADCRKAGFKVTVFEAFHKAGGVLSYGIPEFRLPKEIVQKEIDKLIKMGVKIELNTVINKTVTMEDLIAKFDAVFIGSGAGLPLFLGIKGENLNGVYSANEYLTRINLMKAYEKGSHTPISRGKHTVVLGGGNVAVDAARCAKRLGSETVKIVYRRGIEEMPARREELRHAEEEGIEICVLSKPIEILEKEGRVCGIMCQKCQLGEIDKSGRRKSNPIEGSEFTTLCDTVIVAIGTSPNPLIRSNFEKLKSNPKGTIIVDDNMETNIDKVYAGGDAVTGAATVIQAMGAGKIAARSIVEKLIDN